METWCEKLHQIKNVGFKVTPAQQMRIGRIFRPSNVLFNINNSFSEAHKNLKILEEE